MVDDPIGDELRRLSKEFRKLAGLPTCTHKPAEVSPQHLTKFGLTLDEAKAWMKKEPNYVPADENLHKKRTDEDLTKPIAPLNKGAIEKKSQQSRNARQTT